MLHRWGIVGLGGIATSFATYFDQKNSEIAAVASRKLDKAQAFANEFSIPCAYGSYEELLHDDTITIIYIAVPNKQHIEYILQALNAGKHVLCEKAITTTQKELEEAMALAKKKNLVLAEAMTLFNMPLYIELRKQINANRFGRLKMIQAPFGSYKEPDPTNRFFNPNLAGGALLDIGTYAVSFARWFLASQPEVVATTMLPFSTGVDEQSATILQDKEKEIAVISLSFQAKMPKQGILSFENAYITIDNYPRANQANVYFNDGTTETIITGNQTEAMNYEINNMVKMVDGKLPNQSLFFTHEVISILDQMQNIWQSVNN
ncbi:Gfo/Idh/MocA family protein [Melissococcus plutonius]|uniref:Oxidoreductase, Gfo/Idh/MocA family n=1 Tax=Melissococcus plutonius (strain ATCC 35311 / DSM 29964 / CIP 104052 / LMG 20360 / NCIMB 702443) TaxID=940190 RepID=F3YBB9_MELPT|nr:Gfo/Idh/MocA family oxidoreductase [Melissococcus plutonius]AIM25197.1 oxidoreductase, Gfo/Idh/MocA family [Melissococcus plutonius S1]KMT23832.1 oxidoreductase, Gfo/Idh/MocA family [Melissococcus plutonius]KMT24355.1 oxidoreductase, Gfo/Idh/MocA family [Melissococcus plutonius]KMT25928.1 oxidoreductase, Gfo/Idh/MocA family [Melissococcus plutonius]KMT28479.1 oxidoreductase, Gfo/Idh/MocA family [Melissococcus plutonius]